MAKISEFLKKIMSARYGKDVRQSIHDAIDQINKDVVYESENVTQKAQEVSENAENAKKYKDESEQIKSDVLKAKTDAETAKADAITAKNDAESAKTAAFTAQKGAVTAKTSAETALVEAINAKIEAETAATNAAKSAQDALLNAASGIPDASATVAGKAKLYSGIGSAEDGSMTQKAVNEGINELAFGKNTIGKNLINDLYIDFYAEKIENGELNIVGVYKEKTAYTISCEIKCSSSKYGGIRVFYTDNTNVYAMNVVSQDYVKRNFTTNKNKTVKRIAISSYTSIKKGTLQIEEGSNSTEYKPFYMTNDELTKQFEHLNRDVIDTNMIGWAVPTKCTVKNYIEWVGDGYGRYYQKVDRILATAIEWAYIEDEQYFLTTKSITDIQKPANNEKANIYMYYYTTLSFDELRMITDNKLAISVTSDGKIAVKDIYYNDIQSFISDIEGLYIYYEIDNWEYTEFFTKDNVYVDKHIDEMKHDAIETKMLGWNVPKECSTQNIVSEKHFTQKIERIDLGTMTWEKDENGYYTFIADRKINTSSKHYIGSLLSGYEYGTEGLPKDKTFFYDGTSTKMWIKDTSYAYVELFKKAMQGVYLYYSLATPINMEIDGNEKAMQSDDKIAVNILKPTFETQVLNGVTFTLNDDGTYTLNGTATQDMVVRLQENITLKSNTYYCFNTFFENENDFRSAITNNYNLGRLNAVGDTYCSFFVTDEHVSNGRKFFCALDIKEGKTFSNTIVKPMLSEGKGPKSYVQYTGNTGALNSDVAAIQKDVEEVKGNVETVKGSVETLTNTVNGKAETSYVDGVLELIKDLNGANSPYLGNPNDAKTGLYQFWGNIPEGSPFGVPYVMLSLRTHNFCLQIASPYNGDGLAFRCRGSGVDEWSSWRYLSIL